MYNFNDKNFDVEKYRAEVNSVGLSPSQYVLINGYMAASLGLKGNDLMIYAIIYGFSQIEGQYFTGSRQYLATWTNSTKQGVQKSLNRMVEYGYLEKRERFINNVKHCEYRALRPDMQYLSTDGNGSLPGVGNKVYHGCKQSLPGVGNKVYQGSKQSCSNNIDNNIDIYSSNKIKERKKERGYDSILQSLIADEELRQTIVEFLKMRKMMKKAPTDRALILLIKKLQKMAADVDSQIAIVEQSLTNNWIDFYPLKDQERIYNNSSSRANIEEVKANKERKAYYLNILDKITDFGGRLYIPVLE